MRWRIPSGKRERSGEWREGGGEGGGGGGRLQTDVCNFFSNTRLTFDFAAINELAITFLGECLDYSLESTTTTHLQYMNE